MGVTSRAQQWATDRDLDAQMSVSEMDEIGKDAAEAKANQLLSEDVDGRIRMAIIRTVRMIGGAMITMLLLTVVLNEVFGAVNVGSGPFSGIANNLTTTGVTALGLLVIGLLVVAANSLMGIFGRSGGGM